MANQRDGISWCDETWSPTRGCRRVSEGCQHCLAERMAARLSGPGRPYEGLVHAARWTGRARFVPAMLARPLRWRKPRRIAVSLMGDLFHEDITNEQIAAVFGVMAATQQHTYLLLTKRPGRMVEWFAWLEEARHEVSATPRDFCELMAQGPLNRVVETGDDTWPLPNVWPGISAENQRTLEERWEHLCQVPAAVLWVSYEPGLGSVRLSQEMLEKLGWVVLGGESGPGARPCNVNWIRSVVEQCRDAVPVHVKQLGARPYETKPTPSGEGFDPWDMLSRNPRDEAAHRGWFKGWTLVKTATGSQFVRYPKISDRKGAVMDDWPQELRRREFPHV